MKPLWKQMFDAMEQAAGPAMADATASDAFAEFAKVSSKISKDFNRQLESASREWLHLWNLPAAGDVQYLKRQIGSLENEIRSLHRQNERLHREFLERMGAESGATAEPVENASASLDDRGNSLDDNGAVDDNGPVELEIAS